MTEQKIPCEMIQDLLPLYMDGLTNEVTVQEIEKHMKECGECSGILKRLQTDIRKKDAKKQSESKQEVDFLKKMKRSTAKKIVAGMASVMVLFVLAVLLKLYVIGFRDRSYVVLYTNVYEDCFEVSGMCCEPGSGVSSMCYEPAVAVARYRIEKKPDGTSELIIDTCLPSFFCKNSDFCVKIGYDEIGSGLYAGGVLIKPDGSVIGKMANDVFGARNSYVGDVMADGKLVLVLGMMEEMGTATTELHTKEEPYGWTFHFTDSVKNGARFDERMIDYACVLIAMTDNLSEVSWTYTVETEEGTVERSAHITQEECDAYVGSPIKAFADSPEKVQELLDILDM